MLYLLETKYLFLLLNFIIGYITTLFIISPIISMITEAKFVRPNFRGEPIPIGVGIIFFISSFVVITLNILILPEDMDYKGMLFIIAVTSVTCLGLIDDNWGSRDATGLKGHLQQLIKGRLTTGALKALGGGLIAFFISSLLQEVNNEIWLNTLIIALSINTINLLDLRPGRAGKCFLIGVLLLSIYGWSQDELLFMVILGGIVAAYLPYDLKAKVMMGDTGSNVLGVTLGIFAVWTLTLKARIILLVALIAFHLITEKYSLTRIIERNKILNYFDQLGRDRY